MILTYDNPNILQTFRICVGRHMANNALFIDIATLLWAANISALKDEQGKPTLPDTLALSARD